MQHSEALAQTQVLAPRPARDRQFCPLWRRRDGAQWRLIPGLGKASESLAAARIADQASLNIAKPQPAWHAPESLTAESAPAGFGCPAASLSVTAGGPGFLGRVRITRCGLGPPGRAAGLGPVARAPQARHGAALGPARAGSLSAAHLQTAVRLPSRAAQNWHRPTCRRLRLHSLRPARSQDSISTSAGTRTGRLYRASALLSAMAALGTAVPGGPARAAARPLLLMTASNRGLGYSQASESIVVAAARIAARLQRARSAGPGRRANAMPGFASRGSVKRATRGPGPLTDPGPWQAMLHSTEYWPQPVFTAHTGLGQCATEQPVTTGLRGASRRQ